MRTTLNQDDQALAAAQIAAPGKTKTALNEALRDAYTAPQVRRAGIIDSWYK
jgi:hypothetical protein